MTTRSTYTQLLFAEMATRKQLRKSGNTDAVTRSTERGQALVEAIKTFSVPVVEPEPDPVQEPANDVIYLLPRSSRKLRPQEAIKAGDKWATFDISTTDQKMLKRYPVTSLKAVA